MRAIAVRVACNNFKVPADNEVRRNSITIGAMRLAPQSDVEHLLLLPDRLCAMLTVLLDLGIALENRHPVPDRARSP